MGWAAVVVPPPIIVRPVILFSIFWYSETIRSKSFHTWHLVLSYVVFSMILVYLHHFCDFILFSLGNKWKCVKNKGQLRRPKSERKSAFQFTLEKDWFGLAYLMLASDCIPFLEVFRVIFSLCCLRLCKQR